MRLRVRFISSTFTTLFDVDDTSQPDSGASLRPFLAQIRSVENSADLRLHVARIRSRQPIDRWRVMPEPFAGWQHFRTDCARTDCRPCQCGITASYEVTFSKRRTMARISGSCRIRLDSLAASRTACMSSCPGTIPLCDR